MVTELIEISALHPWAIEPEIDVSRFGMCNILIIINKMNISVNKCDSIVILRFTKVALK